MKTLKVIIVLIGFMFSFNNQIFAIECYDAPGASRNMTKFTGIIREAAATQFKDEAKLEELASYSVCGGPIKTVYEKMKAGLKALVDLEKYEKTPGSKISEKASLADDSSKISDGDFNEQCGEEKSFTLKFMSDYTPVVTSQYKDSDAIRNLYKKYYNSPCSINLGGRKTTIKDFFKTMEMMLSQLKIDVKAIINEEIENIEKSPDGKLTLVANRKHHSPLSKIAVNVKKGIIVTGDESGYLGLWNSRSLQLIEFSLEKHKSRVTDIVVTDSNNIITTDDFDAYVFDENFKIKDKIVLKPHMHQFLNLHYTFAEKIFTKISNNGSLVTLQGSTILYVKPNGERKIIQFKGGAVAYSFDISMDGKYLAVSTKNKIQILSLKSGGVMKTVPMTNYSNIKFSRGGKNRLAVKIITGKNIEIWTVTGKKISNIKSIQKNIEYFDDDLIMFGDMRHANYKIMSMKNLENIRGNSIGGGQPCVTKFTVELVDAFGNSKSKTYDTNGCPYAYTNTGIYVGVNNNIIYINDQGKELVQKEQLTDYKNTFFLNNKIISQNNVWDLYKGINKNSSTLSSDIKLEIGKTNVSMVKETEDEFIEKTFKICDSYKCEVTSSYIYGNNLVGIARIDKSGSISYAIKIFNLDGSIQFEDKIDWTSRITSAAHFQNKLFFSDDKNYLYVKDKKTRKINSNHKGLITRILPIGNFISTISQDKTIKMWTSNGEELLTLISRPDGEWGVIAKNGQFDKSAQFNSMYWVKGIEIIELDQFFDDFYTPGLLSQVYQTGELDDTRSLDNTLKQVIPTVEIVEPKKATTRGLQLAADDSSGCKVVSSQTRGFKKKKKKKKKPEEPGCGEDGTLRVVVKVTDQGGGFQDIVLYHNGKRLESAEGDIRSGKAQKGKTQLVTFRVPLAPGENFLRAEAKSLSRVRARPWQMVVDFEAPKPKGKPDLYLYVVGINKYSNPKFNLNYGRPDAEAVQKALGDNLKLGAFEKVHVSGIYDLEATKGNIKAQFLKFAKQARPRDVFIFYYAGHGRTLKDENGNPVFYLVSSNVGALDQDKTVKKDGLSGLELINYSKKIRAGKQMFLFDACESGSVAKAFARIQKDTGGHILYAAASNQLATEFDSLGHGIFTYTLLKTLEDNKKLNVSLLSGGMDFLLEDLRPKFNLTDQTFGYYRTLEAPNFAIKSM